MVNECQFCKAYQHVKEITQQLEETHHDDKFIKRYFAQLTTRYENTETEQYVSRVTYDEVPLKFCPSCGKKLEG